MAIPFTMPHAAASTVEPVSRTSVAARHISRRNPHFANAVA